MIKTWCSYSFPLVKVYKRPGLTGLTLFKANSKELINYDSSVTMTLMHITNIDYTRTHSLSELFEQAYFWRYLNYL